MKNIHQTIRLTLLTILLFVAPSCDPDLYEDCKNMPEQIIGTGEIIHNAYIRHSDFDNTTENFGESVPPVSANRATCYQKLKPRICAQR